jgi:hypothetical protein
MKNLIKDIKDTFISNPLVAFMMLTLGAVYLLYTDLSNFIHEQQKILTQQVQQQQATTDLLNQISVRIAEIEMKIFMDEDRRTPNTNK